MSQASTSSSSYPKNHLQPDAEARLVIHIGPPKIATTSLQVALENWEADDIEFLGAFQPRERNGITKCNVLNDWARGIESQGSPRVNELIKTLLRNKHKGVASIIVEEVLLDSSQGMTWKNKIRRLGEIRRFLLEIGIDLIPSITLRNPADGIRSLQIEFEPGLHSIEKISLSVFSRSEQAKVFNYRLVLSSLADAGFSQIIMLSFDQMTKSGLDIFAMAGIARTASVQPLDCHNVGKTKKEGSALYRIITRSLILDYHILSSEASRLEKSGPVDIKNLLVILGKA